MTSAFSFRISRAASPLSSLELPQRQGGAVFDLLLRHAAAGRHQRRHKGLIDRVVFPDVANGLLDRRVIQASLNSIVVTSCCSAGGDLEVLRPTKITVRPV